MLNNPMKNFAYMAYQKNEQGFTFITLLLTITIFFMTTPFVGYITKSVTHSSNYHEISIQQFFLFLRDDVIKATNYVVESNAIKLKMNDGTIVSIEHYRDMIRRQVDQRGHEIYLRDVKEVTFTSLPYGIHLTITSIQGESYEKTIIFYK